VSTSIDPRLTFDPVAHHYFWNGRRVPSVTQVLEPLFDWSSVPHAVLERKRQIGQAVHQAIHLELTVGVDPASIDPACVPYFAAWKRFCSECKFEPLLVEQRVYCNLGQLLGKKRHLEYAGTPDEWGLFQGEPALIDWKCSMFLNYEAVGSQTAAYLFALVHGHKIGSMADKRFAVKLMGDGRYKVERYRALDEDLQRFIFYLEQRRTAEEAWQQKHS
jgi:hypothetical protein